MGVNCELKLFICGAILILRIIMTNVVFFEEEYYEWWYDSTQDLKNIDIRTIKDFFPLKNSQSANVKKFEN